MKFPKIKIGIVDIAKKVGCTPASVSLVLNDSPLPSAKMRQRVKLAAAQLGYVPNRMAQSLKRGRTFTMGVVMPYCAEGYVSAFLDAVSVEAAEHGYQLKIHFHRWSTGEEDRVLGFLAESRVEGIMLCGSRLSYENIPIIELLKKQGIPIVGIGPRVEKVFASYLTIDRRRGALELGAYLSGLGHVAVDYFEPVLNLEGSKNVPLNITSCMDALLEGMQRVDRKAKVEFFQTPPELLLSRDDIETHGFSAKSSADIGYRVIENYLESGTNATAVVVSDTMLALKLLAAMRQRGLRCPEDLSVSCFGISDVPIGAVPLTTVEWSVEAMARKAVVLMLAAGSGQKMEPVVSMPTALAIRDSCAAVTSRSLSHTRLIR